MLLAKSSYKRRGKGYRGFLDLARTSQCDLYPGIAYLQAPAQYPKKQRRIIQTASKAKSREIRMLEAMLQNRDYATVCGRDNRSIGDLTDLSLFCVPKL